MKIAIIGSGIAGLIAGHRLSSHHQVTLFERLSRPGMDAHRAEIPTECGAVVADVPSRMFNAAQWPQLTRLYDELGVEYQPVDSTQSFSTPDTESKTKTYLKFKTAYRPVIGPQQVLSSDTRAIMSDAKRLMKQGREDLESGKAGNGEHNFLSLADYLKREKYSHPFIYRFLYPTLSSTVCTCSYSALDNYPADEILKCLRNLTSDATLMQTKNGTGDVVDRLTSTFANPELNTIVQSVSISSETADGQAIVQTADRTHRFDQVIFATQANTALSLLAEPTSEEQQALSHIDYEDTTVVVHTDTTLMPGKRNDWSTFNMINSPDFRSAMCSVWLNRFHREWPTTGDIFQTINPVRDVAPEQEIASIRLQRPVVTARTATALSQLDQIHRQPGRRIRFCGSWAAPGIPLLETGVVSAHRVCDSITPDFCRPDPA